MATSMRGHRPVNEQTIGIATVMLFTVENSTMRTRLAPTPPSSPTHTTRRKVEWVLSPTAKNKVHLVFTSTDVAPSSAEHRAGRRTAAYSYSLTNSYASLLSPDAS